MEMEYSNLPNQGQVPSPTAMTNMLQRSDGQFMIGEVWYKCNDYHLPRQIRICMSMAEGL
jgi:hypothetical protein